MSPWSGFQSRLLTSFPRVSGDEPEIFTITAPTVEFSPRERG